MPAVKSQKTDALDREIRWRIKMKSKHLKNNATLQVNGVSLAHTVSPYILWRLFTTLVKYHNRGPREA